MGTTKRTLSLWAGRSASRRTTLLAALCLFLGLAANAWADAVTDWNLITLQTIGSATPPRPGPSAILDLATVHLAIHDAVAAIDGRFRPYQVRIPGASGWAVAAAAKAARDVLVNRFPGQSASIDLAYQNYLAINRVAATDPGIDVGRQAAAGILEFRANDGSFPSPAPAPFTGGTGAAAWRPTPPALLAMAIPWLGNVRPFALTSSSQFRVLPPPRLTSDQYAREYNEVKAVGALNNSSRTPDQTDLANFWNMDYMGVWNQALRNIAGEHVRTLGESARLFALATMAVADAGITAWDSKNRYNFWRPITAIQEGANDDNPQTTGDPRWQPLIATPPYPDYTSGANNVTGAVTRILQLFFDTDEMTFSVTTNNAAAIQKTRVFRRFTEASQEVVSARVYQGIHFRFADAAARWQGRAVADWAFKHFLRPVTESEEIDYSDR